MTILSLLLLLPLTQAPQVTAASEEAESSEAESSELLELRQQEQAVLGHPPSDELPFFTRHLGLSNPLRLRLQDVLDEDEFAPRLPAAELAPVGDLAAIDLKLLKQRLDIPIAMEPMVGQYIRFFQTSGRRWFITWLNRSTRFLPMMQTVLEARGMPKDTVYLAMIESGFSPQAYSWAKAAGPWQFISATGQRYGLKQDFWVDERKDPLKSTQAAARYLSDLHAKFGDWFLAWASYNAGDGKVRRVMAKKATQDFWELSDGKGLAKETKHYVPKLIAAAILAKNYRAFGFKDEELNFQSPIEHDEASLVDPADLEVLAKAAEVSVDEIKELNPELRRWCTPPATEEEPYVLKLPKGTLSRFTEAWSKIPRTERLTYRVHKIQRGDTLSQISRTYGSAPEAITRMNALKNPRALRLGMELVIPVTERTSERTSERPSVQARRGKVEALRPETETSTGTSAPVASGPQTQKVVNGQTQVTYGVQSGDSLWTIAQKFGVSVSDLRKWNMLGRGKRSLRAGSLLVIWLRSATALAQ